MKATLALCAASVVSGQYFNNYAGPYGGYVNNYAGNVNNFAGNFNNFAGNFNNVGWNNGWNSGWNNGWYNDNYMREARAASQAEFAAAAAEKAEQARVAAVFAADARLSAANAAARRAAYDAEHLELVKERDIASSWATAKLWQNMYAVENPTLEKNEWKYKKMDTEFHAANTDRKMKHKSLMDYIGEEDSIENQLLKYEYGAALSSTWSEMLDSENSDGADAIDDAMNQFGAASDYQIARLKHLKAQQGGDANKLEVARLKKQGKYMMYVDEVAFDRYTEAAKEDELEDEIEAASDKLQLMGLFTMQQAAELALAQAQESNDFHAIRKAQLDKDNADLDVMYRLSSSEWTGNYDFDKKLMFNLMKKQNKANYRQELLNEFEAGLEP